MPGSGNIIPLKFNLKSTQDLAAIVNRQCSSASVLSLERGPFQGAVQIVPLDNIRLSLMELNKTVAIAANRKGNNYHFCINLSAEPFAHNVTAQGVRIEQTAIFGFNSSLRDLDLRLDAGCRFCSITVPSSLLIQKLSQCDYMGMQNILNSFNILSNRIVSFSLFSYLSDFWAHLDDVPLLSSSIEEEILTILFECFLSLDDRKVGLALSRRDRHEAALQVLSLTSASPVTPFEVQDLCSLLHQSRTSLFNGCKEKFNMSPLQVVRSIRLHQVRHALLDIEFCAKHNINGVLDAASHFGFVGRSHFTRYYKQEFQETPAQTLGARRNSDQIF